MGVGRSINFMNFSNIIMKKIFRTISSSVMILALVISAVNAPFVSVAQAQELGGFTFDLPGFDFPTFDFPGFDDPVVMKTCKVEASQLQIPTGGSTTLTWTTSGFDSFTLNGQTISGNNGSIQMTNILQNTTYTLVAQSADGSGSCTASVTITCLPPTPVDCRLEVVKTVDKAAANVGDILTYNITVKNIGTTDCTGSGVKIEDVVNANLTYLTQSVSSNLTAGYEGIPVYTANDRTLHFNGNVLTPNESGTITWTGRVTAPTTCGDFQVPNQAKATALELNNFNTYAYSQTVVTQINNDCVVNDPAPSCDSFTGTPATITVGNSATLAWQTSNASRVVINNGVGEVAVDGTKLVAPLVTTNYQLTAFGTQNRSVTCNVPVTVSSDPVPVCESFTASPNTLPAAGGQVTLAWKVNGATNVSIAPTIGVVATQGTQATNVTTSTNFVLTATDADGDQVTCAAPVTVTSTPPPTLTCANNVSFTTSRGSIREGEDATLNWSTNNIDSLSISVINATALSGSTTVDPRSSTTYVLTARKGTQSVDCPLTINVDTNNGGGGGGSSSPRCELTLSDNKIKAGERVTLKWDTSRATKVVIEDDKGKTIMSTEKYSSKEKDEYYDGSLTLSPTRDTTYTLVASKGSKDRTCKVKVDVDDLTVLTDRDQQPLVAGISLSNVPYTGFEAGPMLTIMFYTLLAAWALFVTYLIVMRPRVSAGIITDNASVNAQAMKRAEAVRPDVFSPSITAAAATAVVPFNLPTGAPVVGYQNVVEVEASANPHQVTSDVVAGLENRAHGQKALLSSDAIRFFIATTEGGLERDETLDKIISEAKTNYPLEDGWIVINEARMQGLCESCVVSEVTSPFTPVVVPEGSSSLAEAIVTGNVVAAYAMIGNRPMFALADAAADLDLVLRGRRGEEVTISALLASETAALTEEKVKSMIAALTGALDGTYSDEASAVKMAIMKAVKEVA